MGKYVPVFHVDPPAATAAENHLLLQPRQGGFNHFRGESDSLVFEGTA